MVPGACAQQVYKVFSVASFPFFLFSHSFPLNMETTLIYAVGSGALFGLCLLRLPLYYFVRLACPLLLELPRLPPINAVVKFASRLITEHLTYPTTLRRGMFFDRWSRRDTLLLLAYFAANVSCILVPLPSIDQVYRRTGTLSVINVLFVFAGPHLSFLADLLGVSLLFCRRLHASAGIMTFVLAIFHSAFAAASRSNVSLENPRNLYALIVRIHNYDFWEVNTDDARRSCYFVPS